MSGKPTGLTIFVAFPKSGEAMIATPAGLYTVYSREQALRVAHDLRLEGELLEGMRREIVATLPEEAPAEKVAVFLGGEAGEFVSVALLRLAVDARAANAAGMVAEMVDEALAAAIAEAATHATVTTPGGASN